MFDYLSTEANFGRWQENVFIAIDLKNINQVITLMVWGSLPKSHDKYIKF